MTTAIARDVRERAVDAVPERVRLLHIATVPMSLVFLRGQVAYFQARGFETQAISSPGPELDAFGREHGIRTTAITMHRRIAPGHDIAAIGRLRAAIGAFRPHIVHAHTPKAGLLGMLAAALERVPVRIYHMRGLPMTGKSGAKRLILGLSERIACAAAHRVVCVSHSLREVAIAERLCAPSKIRVLAGGSGNGVDGSGRFDPDSLSPDARTATRTRLSIPHDALVVGFIGRVVRDKGIVELAQAWRSVRDEYPRAHLLIVGPPEPHDPVPADVLRRLRTDPRVCMAGEDWDTPPLYSAMDMVALPTYREGFPNVPLEAAAMRLPVIATRVPGCTDAVEDGTTGILVPRHCAESLAGALRVYLGDAARRRADGEAGRRRVLELFRQEVIWDALYDEYRRLLHSQESAVLAAEART